MLNSCTASNCGADCDMVASKILLPTWLFWAAVSLLNFSFLGGLAIPPLLFLGDFYLKSLSFAIWPAVVASCAATVIAIRLFRNGKGSLVNKTIGINAIFLVAFLASAEVRTAIAMRTAAQELRFDCFDGRPFFVSLLRAGEEFQFRPHAVGNIGSEFYLWSYRDMRFFPVPESIWKNLELGRCEVSPAAS